MPEGFDYFVELAKEFGLRNAIFTTFFFGAHWWLFWMYNGRLQDRQDEIDRLAQDNREYRERFLAITDDRFSYDPEKRRIKKPKRER